MAKQFAEEEFTKSDLKIWRQIFYYLRTSKRNLLLLFGSVVLLALLDTAWPQLVRIVIDDYVLAGNLDGLWEAFGMFFAFSAAFGFIVWAFIFLANLVKQEATYLIRKAGFKKLQELSFSYYDTSSVGWLMSRMTSDTNRIGDILSWGFVDFGWGILVMSLIGVVMVLMNWQLALLTIAIVPVMGLASFWFQTRILKQFRQVRKLNSRITGAFNEGITGAVTTKTLVTEADNLQEFSAFTADMMGASVQASVLSAVYFPLMMTLGSVGAALIIYNGGMQVSFGDLSFGELVMFLSYARFFFDPVMILARRLTQLQEAQASAERVISLLNTDPDIMDTPEVAAKYGAIGAYKKKNWEPLAGEIVLRDVGFKYKTGEEVMSGMDLEIPAGTSVAIVGPTGSGKSTLVNLICRFYEPTSGEILIDGVNYQERSQEWLHSQLGYVLQTPQLFSGSIRENIRYGALGASDGQVEAAAKIVGAHGFIMNFEGGYDSKIGENGAGLSTGQKQLISFARALIGDPKLLVLDEATSSIDIETESLLQQAIQALLKDRTSLIIAHRLSTIVGADLILYLKDGKIVEKGTHVELLSLKGEYHQLYTGQFEQSVIV
ncbi:MAG: ABC transporter ATP-binding protein/permease [Turicibacter sp.]|nr:ABC transporter ATP-binding protein/permease [Turicibacter sp.]